MLSFVKNLLTMFITIPFIFEVFFESLLIPNRNNFSFNFFKKSKNNVADYGAHFTRK